MAEEHGWLNRRMQSELVSAHEAHSVHNLALPSFSLAVFLDHLVQFIVADDQVRLANSVFSFVLIFVLLLDVPWPRAARAALQRPHPLCSVL